ncbi:hypothetical protein DERF_005786 [Dermatophagoides farinae]|uniref:Uncharacterized protein n=1 Tax=Dermatophagoides farinae TaxID=6954 RepID=A0A922L7H7_DERFA|nr:hypothetical protein DERF_005786 [Dermatophagoides farinae]
MYLKKITPVSNCSTIDFSPSKKKNFFQRNSIWSKKKNICLIHVIYESINYIIISTITTKHVYISLHLLSSGLLSLNSNLLFKLRKQQR